MSSASKYFYKAIGRITCSELIHLNGETNCWEVVRWNMTKTVIGCCKYVLPIAAIPLALKINRLDIHVLRESLLIFFEYSFASWIMGAFALNFICLFYRILGRFYYTTVIAFPTFCSSSICACIMSDKLISMFSHGLSTIAIEVSIARGDFYVLPAVRDSPLWRTLGFMVVNTMLMNVLRYSNGSNMWFLRPSEPKSFYPSEVNNNTESQKPKESESSAVSLESSSKQNYCKVCENANGCQSYIFEQMFKLMKLGLGVEIIKTLIENFDKLKANPKKILFSMPFQLNCNFPAFLITYTGIYRYINCWMSRNTSLSSNVNNSVSAFVSGFSFLLYPSTQLLAHAFAATVPLGWLTYIKLTNPSGRPNLLNQLARFPIARICYPLCFAYLMQMRTFYPWLAPPILKKLMNLTTNYKDDQVFTKYHETLLGGVHSDEATLYLFGLDK